MFSAFFKIQNISFSEKMNSWIYIFTKIPLLGKLTPKNIYNSNKTKVIISNIARVFAFIFQFLGKFIYLILAIGLPALYISRKTNGNEQLIAVQIFFFLSFILEPIVNNMFTMYLGRDFFMINLMRFDAKQYYLSNILFNYITDMISFFVVIKFMGVPLFETFVIVTGLMSFRVIIQAFYVLTNKVMGFHLSSKPNLMLLSMFIPTILAYGLPFIDLIFNIKSMFMNMYFMAILVGLAIISLIYLITYKKYTALGKRILLKDEIDKLTNISKNAPFNDIAIDNKKIDTKSLIKDKYENEHGIKYLNLKFIERHKKIIFNPVKRIVIVVLALFVAALGVIISFPKSHEIINETILSSTGILVFILYVICIGEKTTKAFFFNCDNSLLRYSFYTEPKFILQNFKERVKLVTLFNLIPALTMGISLLIIMILIKGDIIRFIPIFVSIITLSIFFTVHYLFLYYITQPYTSQLKIKSPIYRFASVVVYCLAIIALQIRTANLFFTIGIIILTIIYTLVSLFMVKKYAHKTFRFK